MKRTWAVVLCAVLALVGCNGCGAGVAPHLKQGLEVADCQIATVRALVPHVETADAVVAAARVGDIRRAVELLQALGMSQEEIMNVAKAFDACVPAKPEPVINIAPVDS